MTNRVDAASTAEPLIADSRFSEGGWMRRIVRVIPFMLLMVWVIPAFAMKPPLPPPPPNPQAVTFEDPAVHIKPSRSYTAKRIALFPFELPDYVFKTVLWPIGETLEWMQREHYNDRVADAFSLKSEKIWVYPVVDLTPGSSFGGGAAVKVLDLIQPGDNIDADYHIHVNMDMFADFNLYKLELFRVGEVPIVLSVTGGWQKQGSYSYYGVGNETVRSGQSSWNEQDLDGIVRIGARIKKDLTMYAIAGSSATSTGGASSDGVDPADFPPVGYGRWLPYVRAGAGIEHDSTDVPANPKHGGVHSIEFSRYQYMGGGGNFSYNDVRLLLSQYFPLWSPNHTLMLRTEWEIQQSSGDVPTPRLVTLDADNWLRGFDRGRFKDKGGAVFNAEYYFPLFSRLRGMMLLDFGRVFDDIRNFSFKDFKYSFGGGFDMEGTREIVFRFRAAYGGEGVKFMFSLLRKNP